MRRARVGVLWLAVVTGLTSGAGPVQVAVMIWEPVPIDQAVD